MPSCPLDSLAVSGVVVVASANLAIVKSQALNAVNGGRAFPPGPLLFLLKAEVDAVMKDAVIVDPKLEEEEDSKEKDALVLVDVNNVGTRTASRPRWRG